MSAGRSEKEQQLPLTEQHTQGGESFKEPKSLKDLIQISAITVQPNTTSRKHCGKKE